MPDTRVRWLCLHDLPQVLAIEEAVEPGLRWGRERIRRETQDRNRIGMVATWGDGLVVGYVIYEMGRDKIVLVRLAVDPIARRAGVARALIETLKGKLSIRRRNRIACTVRESRIDLCRTLAAAGFESRLVRDGYRDPDEDGVRFVWSLPFDAPAAQLAPACDATADEPFH